MARKGKLGQKATKEIIERPKNVKRYEYFFLIVCEDGKTEPEYFKQFVDLFPDRTLYVRPVGTGLSPLGVVERAIIEKAKLQKESKREFGRDDAVWVVFDKDDADLNDTKRRNFNEAFKIAKQNKFEIAYSNEAFELWFLLHLEEVPSHPPIPRSDIYTRLGELIRQNPNESNFVYDHGNIEIVEKINQFGNELNAIERAEILLQAQKGVAPIQANPSTKVHLLVKELRDWAKFYSD
ncbi:putative Abortive phage resistance protein [Planktothrix serta PCC 8927]|uniref:Abortive phage resistance protein n=1 Tax=Planktothrix serta PCC 8927 TaxID=671068 RepID=A0A7Z9E5C7_9CYAN|nr:RloB family protein [Planktothrix serta]VXD24493.1 putative Abortive phage resistance protein [Planktothrix serta PCC 8927]